MAMATRLLCSRPPSYAAPSATLPSSRLLRSGGSSPLSRPAAGLKMQTGTAARLRPVPRCAADWPSEPSPEEDPRDARCRRFRDDLDKLDRDYGAALLALGAGSIQDAMVDELVATLFRDEEDELQTYEREIASNRCILYKEGRRLAKMVCLSVDMAIHLSAWVTANAHWRVSKSSDEMSPQTVERIIRTYVSTFLKTAEDACHRKVDRASIISFLGALRGLAAISHILFEDTLRAINNTEGGSSNYRPEDDVEALNRELLCNMKELEMKFTEAPERQAYELLSPTLTDATHLVSLFVFRMTGLRRKALVHEKA